jgi:hypothetical protein
VALCAGFFDDRIGIALDFLNQIIALRDDPSVADLMLLTHANASGTLADSWGNEVIRNLFVGRVQPGLMSLTFFSCFGEDAAHTYQVEQALGQGPSYYSRRYFLNAQVLEHNQFLEGKDHSAEPSKTPTPGGAPSPGPQASPGPALAKVTSAATFGPFLRAMDEFLAPRFSAQWKEQLDHPERFRARAVAPSSRGCRLRTQGLGLVSGSVGFYLNRELIGVVNSPNIKLPYDEPLSRLGVTDEAEISFECGRLKADGDNVLIIRGSRLDLKDLEDPTQTSGAIDVRWALEAGTVSSQKTEQFTWIGTTRWKNTKVTFKLLP